MTPAQDDGEAVAEDQGAVDVEAEAADRAALRRLRPLATGLEATHVQVLTSGTLPPAGGRATIAS